jgi:hypothetical protein
MIITSKNLYLFALFSLSSCFQNLQSPEIHASRGVTVGIEGPRSSSFPVLYLKIDNYTGSPICFSKSLLDALSQSTSIIQNSVKVSSKVGGSWIKDSFNGIDVSGGLIVAKTGNSLFHIDLSELDIQPGKALASVNIIAYRCADIFSTRTPGPIKLNVSKMIIIPE